MEFCAPNDLIEISFQNQVEMAHIDGLGNGLGLRLSPINFKKLPLQFYLNKFSYHYESHSRVINNASLHLYRALICKRVYLEWS